MNLKHKSKVDISTSSSLIIKRKRLKKEEISREEKGKKEKTGIFCN